MGVTRKKVEGSGIGGRARTMAGAGPTDLHCRANSSKMSHEELIQHYKLQGKI